MAKQLFSNAYLMVNSVNLSDHIRSVTLNASTEIVDATTMSAAVVKEKIVSWDDWSIDVEFAQDFKTAAAGAVDVTLWAVRTGHAAVAIILKPNGDTTAATNPKWTGNAIMTSYSFGGGVGDLATATAKFEGSGAVTRAVAD